MLEFDLDFRLGLPGTVVPVSVGEERLKREAKLERLELDFSVRTGEFPVDGDVVGVFCFAE